MIGLQVVALGGGKFDAVAYRGGLPGAGWNRRAKTKLSGQLVNGSLILLGKDCNYLVAGGIATSLDATGRLTKVERVSPTLGLAPPKGAVVLFDGGSTEHWTGAKVTQRRPTGGRRADEGAGRGVSLAPGVPHALHARRPAARLAAIAASISSSATSCKSSIPSGWKGSRTNAAGCTGRRGRT